MEIVKYNWKYRYKNVKGKSHFEVIPDEKLEIPKTLFKLFALNHFSFDSLINGYVYATHPSQFNDLFDCNEELIEFDDDEICMNFLKDTYGEEQIKEAIKKTGKDIRIFVQRNFRELLYRKLGVFSMTSDPNNILMWSYYTNHQGFAVEYDYSKFPFGYHGPFPVNYPKEIAPISLKESGIQLAILYQSNVKYHGWMHENEWRLLIESSGKDMYSPSFESLRELGGHNRRFHYPIESIQSIALGNRFFVPEELHKLDENSLQINLLDNVEKKSIMLDLLAENKIVTHIGICNKNLISISFTPKGKLERINYKTYKYTAESIKEI